MSITVSVVIPAYNSDPYVGRIIVIYDGSTDNIG